MDRVESMTGFATVEGQLPGEGGGAFAWDARSVNNRGLDVKLRLPPGFERLEAETRRRLSAAFARGSIQVALQLARTERAGRFRVNDEQLAAYLVLAARLERDHGLARPSADAILSMKGVLEPADEAPADADGAADDTLLAALDTLLERLKAARRAEGARLAVALAAHVDAVETLVGEIDALAGTFASVLWERLKRQVEELATASAGLSVDRLHQEAALLATKADVREEIDRLRAHVAAARDLLAAGEPVGRRLDFLAQEFNREANTILSKSPATAMTEKGLALKARIEQMREQVQNVE